MTSNVTRGQEVWEIFWDKEWMNSKTKVYIPPIPNCDVHTLRISVYDEIVYEHNIKYRKLCLYWDMCLHNKQARCIAPHTSHNSWYNIW